jgi:hypothetical protein
MSLLVGGQFSPPVDRIDRSIGIDYGALGGYSCLFLLTLAVALARSLRNPVAYIALGGFCILNIAGAAIGISKRDGVGYQAITTITTVDSVSEAFLIIALGSVTAEVHTYFADARRKGTQGKTEKLFIRIFHVIIIILCTLGLSCLVIAGGVAGYLDSPPKNNHWTRTLSKVGCVVQLFTWIGQYIYIVLLWWFIMFRAFASLSNAIKGLNLRWGISLLVVAGVFTVVRVAGTTVYYVKDIEDGGKYNPVTGTFGFRAGLLLVPSLLAAILLLVAGWMTRNTGKEVKYTAMPVEGRNESRVSTAPYAPYGDVPLMPKKSTEEGHGRPGWYAQA